MLRRLTDISEYFEMLFAMLITETKNYSMLILQNIQYACKYYNDVCISKRPLHIKLVVLTLNSFVPKF